MFAARRRVVLTRLAARARGRPPLVPDNGGTLPRQDPSRPAMSLARPLVLALAAAALAPAALAAAARPASAAVAARAASAAPPAFASREQLRQCLADEDRLQARFAAIQARHAEHARRVAALEAENDRIVQAQAQLDTASEVAVNAFNLLVSEHNVHIKELNEDASAGHAEADAYNAAIQEHNRGCVHLVYRVDDLDAVTKERRAAAAAAAASR
jgi:hypothetical protein